MSNGNLEFSDTAQLCSVLLEIAQLGSELLGQLLEATALEPVKLPLILSGVCSLFSANYFPNPFGIFSKIFQNKCIQVHACAQNSKFVDI